jgi:hypothetical protein
MGTSTLKSSTITNRDAVPKVVNDARLYGSLLQSAFGTATSAASDDTSSTYRLVAVPSNCIVRGVYYSTAAQGGSAAVDIGVFRDTLSGGAVVDADFFASALGTATALARTDCTYESAVYTAAKRVQPLWQAAGLSADPGGELDIVVSVQATVANAVAMSLEVQYVM